MKSSLHKIKMKTGLQSPLVYLLVFSLVSLLVSFGTEMFLHLRPCPLCLTQRYLLILIALNGFLGARSLFKVSYIITCKILLVVLFIASLTLTSIKLGFKGHLAYFSQKESSAILKLLEDPHSFFYGFHAPLSLFNVLGASIIFFLLDPLKNPRNSKLENEEHSGTST
ncbi:MAG: disulfide bond formation protein B [Rhabdochlamydiaceae bacterium]